ncbi:MAG: hypothetical protein JWM12_3891 [Ilumatobacteraceae bacterium]|nr:hypothetical protein [Ilumatobacteraceae bacterium]
MTKATTDRPADPDSPTTSVQAQTIEALTIEALTIRVLPDPFHPVRVHVEIITTASSSSPSAHANSSNLESPASATPNVHEEPEAFAGTAGYLELIVTTPPTRRRPSRRWRTAATPEPTAGDAGDLTLTPHRSIDRAPDRQHRRWAAAAVGVVALVLVGRAIVDSAQPTTRPITGPIATTTPPPSPTQPVSAAARFLWPIAAPPSTQPCEPHAGGVTDLAVAINECVRSLTAHDTPTS